MNMTTTSITGHFTMFQTVTAVEGELCARSRHGEHMFAYPADGVTRGSTGYGHARRAAARRAPVRQTPTA